MVTNLHLEKGIKIVCSSRVLVKPQYLFVFFPPKFSTTSKFVSSCFLSSNFSLYLICFPSPSHTKMIVLIHFTFQLSFLHYFQPYFPYPGIYWFFHHFMFIYVKISNTCHSHFLGIILFQCIQLHNSHIYHFDLIYLCK